MGLVASPQRGGSPPSQGEEEERGWGHLKPHEPFQLLCQNITRHGPMLTDFIKSHGECHGYALGGHHLPLEGCEEEEVTMGKMGMRSIWKPGQATGRGPSPKGPRRSRRAATSGREVTLGSACVLANAKFATRKIPGWDEHEIEDLAGLVWPLKSQQIATCSGYLRPGVGTGGVNAARLASWAVHLNMLAMPWIVYADWNNEPHKLATSGWLGLTGSKVIVPRGAVATCSGGRGRLPDYTW